MTSLPAYLDAVEQGRIPADEIAHETRLARTAFKEALAEAVRAEREACAQWHDTEAERIRCSIDPLTVHQIGAIGDHEEAALAIRSRPSPDVAVVNADGLTADEGAEVRAAVEYAEQIHLAGLRGRHEGLLMAARWHEDSESLARETYKWALCRSDKEIADAHAKHAAEIKAGPLAKVEAELRAAIQAAHSGSQPSTPPPDLAAMRRVVEALKLARRVVVSVASEAWPAAELHLHGSRVHARAVPRKIVDDICRLEGVLDDALSALPEDEPDDEEARAQEADHDR